MEQPEVIKAIQRRHSQIEVDINELKKDFWRMITDRMIPLENRWRAFKGAPSFLKETSPWYFKTVGLTKLLDQHHDGENVGQLLDCDRYSVVRVGEMIDGLEEYAWFTPEVCDVLKEEILSRNLMSWTYDW